MSVVTGVEKNARHEDGGIVSGGAIPDRVVGAGLSKMESSGARRNKDVHHMETGRSASKSGDTGTALGWPTLLCFKRGRRPVWLTLNEQRWERHALLG